MGNKKRLSLVLAALLSFVLAAPVFGLTLRQDTGVRDTDGIWAEEFPEEELPEEPPEETEPFLLEQVSFPGPIVLMLDPYEIQGRGQISSRPIVFSNEGEASVKITIQGLRCLPGPGIVLTEGYAYAFASAESYLPHEAPVNPPLAELLAGTEGKRAQLFLRSLDTGDCLILSEEETSLDFLLEPGETAAFELAGNMTVTSWNREDLAVEMRFLLEDAGWPPPASRE